MIKPKALKQGDIIGLIAPASPVKTPMGVQRAAAKLKEAGYRVVLGESCSQVYGYLAGRDDVRAQDVNRMFLDPNINAVFCVRGGYGSPRILDLLDYEAIRRHPKLFLGYSDITAMHIAFQELCGLVTFHGPMPASDMIFDEYNTFTQTSFLRAVTATVPLGKLESPFRQPCAALVGGKAKGILCGGNLSLIVGSLGTPYEIDTRGKILLLEDIGEKTYRIDSKLNQLRLSGKLSEAAGILLGDFTDCPIDDEDFGLSLAQIYADLIAPVQKPTISHFKAGHGKNKITVPLGVLCELDGDARAVTLTEAALVE